MVERIEDFRLPAAVVNRLMKETLPGGVILSKGARATVNHTASVFILYLTTWSTHLAKQKKQKTLTAKHVLEALEQLDFQEYVKPVSEDLELHRKMLKDKKDGKAKAKVPESSNEGGATPSDENGVKEGEAIEEDIDEIPETEETPDLEEEEMHVPDEDYDENAALEEGIAAETENMGYTENMSDAEKASNASMDSD